MTTLNHCPTHGYYAKHLDACPRCSERAETGQKSVVPKHPAPTLPDAVRFTVTGNPVSKGRPRTIHRRGKARTITPAKTKAYEATVAQYAALAMAGREPYSCPVSLALTIRRKDNRRVDIDNIIKSVMDGMETIVYNNDAQVVQLYARLRRKQSAPGVDVVVSPIQEAA